MIFEVCEWHALMCNYTALTVGVSVNTCRFDEALVAIGQTGDVNLRLQFVFDGCEETLRAVDAHDGLFTDLHTDTSHQLLHRDLQNHTNIS